MAGKAVTVSLGPGESDALSHAEDMGYASRTPSGTRRVSAKSTPLADVKLLFGPYSPARRPVYQNLPG